MNGRPLDDELIQQLAEGLHSLAKDDDRVAMLMSGYDLVMGEVTMAELVFDSSDSPMAVRAQADASSEILLMTFRSGDVDLEFEWTAGTLTGRIDPVLDCVVFLDRLGSSVTSEPDSFGSFEFEGLGTASFRLRLSGDCLETDIATPWIAPSVKGFPPD